MLTESPVESAITTKQQDKISQWEITLLKWNVKIWPLKYTKHTTTFQKWQDYTYTCFI